MTNLARHARIDPETALRAANRKFERRFGFIESALATRGVDLKDADLATMEALWTAAKTLERASPTSKVDRDPR